MAGKIKLNQDFKEFIQSLNDNNVRYLIVGGYAVALYLMQIGQYSIMAQMHFFRSLYIAKSQVLV